MRTLQNRRRRAEGKPSIAHKRKRSWRKVTLYRGGRTGFAYVDDAYSMPEVLSLQENYEETVHFLKALREQMAERWLQWKQSARVRAATSLINKPGITPYFDKFWDFSKIEKLTPEVALIIAAEFDVFTRNIDGVVNGVLELEKWKPSVVRLLEGIGFFELTKVVPPSNNILSGQDFKILRFKAGSIASGASVQNLLQELGLRELLDDATVFEAIAEAITNTRHHAYKNHNLPLPVVEDWWMTGFSIPKQRRVSISVWDRGLTIPATLPSWERYPIVQRVFKRAFGLDEDMTSKHHDGSAIRVAMAAGRSSTNLSHRGKGLPLIESIVGLCASGHMRIHSRCGTYERVKGRKAVAQRRNSELGGTLITWDWQFHAE